MKSSAQEIFKGLSPIYKELIAYGFDMECAAGGELYSYSDYLMNGAFRVELTVKRSGGTSGASIVSQIYDAETGDEFNQIDKEQYVGSYVGAVREAYHGLLSDIASHCFLRTDSAWIIPSNPGVYDIWKGFAQSPEKSLIWHQRIGCRPGDILFIYHTEPIASLVCRCEVIEANIMDDKGDGITRDRRLMKIRLIERYPNGMYPRSFLNRHGIKLTVRGQRSCPPELLNAVLFE